MPDDRGNRAEFLLVKVNCTGVVVPTVDATGPAFDAHLVDENIQVIEVTLESLADTGDSHLEILSTSVDCTDSSYTGRCRIETLDKCACDLAFIFHGLPIIIEYLRDDSMEGIMGDVLPIESGSIVVFQAFLPKGLVLVIHLVKMVVAAHTEHVGDSADHIGKVVPELGTLGGSERNSCNLSVAGEVVDIRQGYTIHHFGFVVTDMEVLSAESRGDQSSTGRKETDVGDLVMQDFRNFGVGERQHLDIQGDEGTGLETGEVDSLTRGRGHGGAAEESNDSVAAHFFTLADFTSDEAFTVEVIIVDPGKHSLSASVLGSVLGIGGTVERGDKGGHGGERSSGTASTSGDGSITVLGRGSGVGVGVGHVRGLVLAYGEREANENSEN